MNPFQAIKNKIEADAELKNEQQRQRIERLAQLEAEQKRKGLHIPNPVQSMRTKKEIKQLKKEIAAFEENKRNSKMVLKLVLAWVLLMCFIAVMAILDDKSPANEPLPSDTLYTQETTEFVSSTSLDVTDTFADTTQVAEDTEAVIDTTEVHAEDDSSDIGEVITEAETEPVQLSSQKFRIKWSAKLVDSNHVGNNWSKTFEVNDEVFSSGSVITVDPDSQFTVCLTIQENDSKPDTDYYFARITYSEELCENGCEISETLYVTENAGRYSGNSAEWNITITITPVK